MKPGSILIALMLLLMCGCKPELPRALGTLERDRISLPSPSFERIAEVRVVEGATVRAGDVLLSLESERSQARTDSALGELARVQAALAEAHAGPRAETIAEAEARWRKTRSVALNAGQEFDRIAAIVERKLLPAAELDRARAQRDAANSDVVAARSSVDALRSGTRIEQVAQSEAAVQAAQAQVESAELEMQRIQIRAPRDGVIESLPYKLGDQPPAGAVLAVLLVGERAHARVYVPQALRSAWQIGAAVEVQIAGETTPRAGKVRTIRSESVFTPYYALSGKDSTRLSYLSEVELLEADARLALGVPVSAVLVAPAQER